MFIRPSDHFVHWADQMHIDQLLESAQIDSEFFRIMAGENELFFPKGIKRSVVTVQEIADYLKLNDRETDSPSRYNKNDDSMRREIILYYLMLVISTSDKIHSQNDSYLWIKSLDKLSSLFEISEESCCFYSFVLNLDKKHQQISTGHQNQRFVFDQIKANLFNRLLRNAAFISSLADINQQNSESTERRIQMIVYIIQTLIDIQEYNLAIQFYYIFLPQNFQNHDLKTNIIKALVCASHQDSDGKIQYENKLLSILKFIRQNDCTYFTEFAENLMANEINLFLRQKNSQTILLFIWNSCRKSFKQFTAHQNTALRPFICTIWDSIVYRYVNLSRPFISTKTKPILDHSADIEKPFKVKFREFIKKNWKNALDEIGEQMNTTLRKRIGSSFSPNGLQNFLKQSLLETSNISPSLAHIHLHLTSNTIIYRRTGSNEENDEKDPIQRLCQDLLDQLTECLDVSEQLCNEFTNTILNEIETLTYEKWVNSLHEQILKKLGLDKNSALSANSLRSKLGKRFQTTFQKICEDAFDSVLSDLNEELEPSNYESLKEKFIQKTLSVYIDSNESFITQIKKLIEEQFNNNLFKQGFQEFLKNEAALLIDTFNKVITKASREVKNRVFIQSSIDSNRIKEFVYLPFDPSEISDYQRILSGNAVYQGAHYLPQFQYSFNPELDQTVNPWSPEMWIKKFNPCLQHLVVEYDRETYDSQKKLDDIFHKFFQFHDLQEFQQYRNRNSGVDPQTVLNNLVLNITEESLKTLNPSPQSCLLVYNSVDDNSVGLLNDSIIAAINHKLQGYTVYFLKNPTSMVFKEALSFFLQSVMNYFTVYFISDRYDDKKNSDCFVFNDDKSFHKNYLFNGPLSLLNKNYNGKSQVVFIFDCPLNPNPFAKEGHPDGIIFLSLAANQQEEASKCQGLITYCLWTILRNNPSITPPLLHDFLNSCKTSFQSQFGCEINLSGTLKPSDSISENCLFPRLPSLLRMFNDPRR